MWLRERMTSPGATQKLLLGSLAAGTALVLLLLLANAWTLQSGIAARQAENAAHQFADALASYAKLVRAQAGLIARSAEVIAATATADPAQLSALQARLRDGIVTVESVQIVPLGDLGIANPSFTQGQLRNNIEIDAAGKAYKGVAVRPAAYLHGGTWLLVVAVPIPSVAAATPGGVLLVRARLREALEDFLLPPDTAAEYSLWAVAPGSAPIEVARAGNPAAGTTVYRAVTAIAGIEAGIVPGASGEASLVLRLLPVVIAMLAGAALLGVLLLNAIRQLLQNLQRDADSLFDMAVQQRASTAAVPALYYAVLARLGEAVLRLRRDAAETPRREVAAVARRAAVPVDPPPAADAPVELPAAAELVVPAEIFRAYDIRGRAEQISDELACAIGRAIGSTALERGQRAITVGADGRLSSPRLRDELVRGLLMTGIDVIDVGTLATPMLYFACEHLQTHTGVMVTGSHNPPDQNGFKIMIAGDTLCGEQVDALRDRIVARHFVAGQGSYRVTEIDADYVRAVSEDVLIENRPKVVIDCANGAAAVIAVELFQELGCDVYPLFCELDGRFPNHAPDPAVPANLRALIAEVARRGADVGIAFDGDGDRIGVVAASGRIVPADRLLMLLARELLSRHPGADVVFDVKCSRDLGADVIAHGGRPVMWRSGHSWIKQKMKESGALLGGEFTGHICFRDRWYGFDDALYCAARLLEIITSEGQTLDQLLVQLPQSVGTPEIAIPVDEADKFALMAEIEAKLEPSAARIVRIDGLRAEYGDGWALVRASNTSAALICRFEGRTEDALARIQADFAAALGRVAPAIDWKF